MTAEVVAIRVLQEKGDEFNRRQVDRGRVRDLVQNQKVVRRQILREKSNQEVDL